MWNHIGFAQKFTICLCDIEGSYSGIALAIPGEHDDKEVDLEAPNFHTKPFTLWFNSLLLKITCF